jgi:ferredoxin
VSRRFIALLVDPVACGGRGVCAELLPEKIVLDRWGYPVISDPEIRVGLVDVAKRAVRACPCQALHLVDRAR